MDPLVSFVVPCYQVAQVLPQCVNSILAQDFRDFEVLIIDNCSQDETPQVAQSFKDPRVKYTRNDSNLGPVRNFNKGITQARGRYVWLLPADDILRSPHVLGRFVDVMERNPRAGFVFCRATELHEDQEMGVGQWADCGNEDGVWDGPTFLAKLIEANCIVASSVLVRRECYDKVGMYQPDLPFACDWYLWSMLALNYDVAYLADPMVCIRFHENSLTTLYSLKHARVSLSDELGVQWRIAHQAELKGLPSIRRLCESALVRRAIAFLKTGLEDETEGVGPAEFEEILRTRIDDAGDRERVRASVYRNLADEQYWGGEYAQAAESYRLALVSNPWNPEIWTKYLLLGTGAVGFFIRQLSHQRRR